jgi:hypothetical protein
MFLLGKTFDDWEDLSQDNACINIINENQKGIFEAETINMVAHLKSGVE